MRKTMIVKLCFGLVILSSIAEAQGLTPPLSRWMVGGGALKIAPHENYYRLQVPANADWGNCYVEGQADISTYPYLALWVVEVGRDAKWQMTVNDPDSHTVQTPSEGVGLYVYDLRKTPEWSGTKKFRIYFTVQGRGRYVDAAWVDLCKEPPFQENSSGNVRAILQWNRMNNCLDTAKEDGLTVSLAQSGSDQWGGAQTKVNVDVDRFPFVEVDVRRVASQTRWRVEVGGQATGPEHRNTGLLAFNYRDANNWRGQHEADIRVITSGPGGEVQFASVRLTAFPSASAELVDRASKVLPASPAGEPRLTTGEYRLDYEPSFGFFRIHRKDSDACLATRFLEMPGLNLAPPSGQIIGQHKPEGDEISFLREYGGVECAVQVETFVTLPGLLHWRVTGTPRTATALSSCGHELCFVPPPAERNQTLRRITSQNMCANAVAFAVAPGVGTILYFQNLTALNPLFDLCHTSPRWMVSVGGKTLGFANPLDTSAKLAAGTSLALVDAWLYLVPSESNDGLEQAIVFLQGLSAIYDRLPDKPDTELRDWQQLARLSLKDLQRPECWGVFDGKEYLQPYVNTHGAVAHLPALQDVLAPLEKFQRQTGEGDDIVIKLRSVLPDFWYPKRGTFREYAQPGEHIWWGIEFHVNLCRAALAGDEQAKALCLRSADALIRLAKETNYSFQSNETVPFVNEYPGVFTLFMMLCYELSPDPRFLAEAQRAAEEVKDWGFKVTRNVTWSAMTCESLARLYAATKEERYVQISLVPLAGVMRLAWLWDCRYGHSSGYHTFWGLNSDASQIDYITPGDQHQSWFALREYYLRTRSVLPLFAKCLVTEFIRYAPLTAWYTYPPNLPPESLHQGPAFWKTINVYDMYIPVEDLNEGWRKNGSVGQMLYGAGAAFDFAAGNYARLPEAGISMFCESPVLRSEWDDKVKTLRVQVGGVSHHETTVEIHFDPALSGWQRAEDLKARCLPLNNQGTARTVRTQVVNQALRMTVPGESVLIVSKE